MVNDVRCNDLSNIYNNETQENNNSAYAHRILWSIPFNRYHDDETPIIANNTKSKTQSEHSNKNYHPTLLEDKDNEHIEERKGRKIKNEVHEQEA